MIRAVDLAIVDAVAESLLPEARVVAAESKAQVRARMAELLKEQQLATSMRFYSNHVAVESLLRVREDIVTALRLVDEDEDPSKILRALRRGKKEVDSRLLDVQCMDSEGPDALFLFRRLAPRYTRGKVAACWV